MDLRCLRERKLPPGYFLKLHHGQLISSYNDNNQSDPFTTTSSTRLQDRLRIRLRLSLQQFLATRLKPGRRRAKEHNHRIHLTLNEYNYLKSIGIKKKRIGGYLSFDCFMSTSVDANIELFLSNSSKGFLEMNPQPKSDFSHSECVL
ncbi:unnamed protein product [Didymodactylos carnosus]|uniref:Uncharacterized protein n=1 Tax=Didymodactylos carnosus TaxID=1234261 RepID=A0A814RIB4_9BILA|nr:unnamed protein product [Didymodactylos carnosus]CAF3897762.1 unnamed protein product [Didymodactylos carnosus]